MTARLECKSTARRRGGGPGTGGGGRERKVVLGVVGVVGGGLVRTQIRQMAVQVIPPVSVPPQCPPVKPLAQAPPPPPPPPPPFLLPNLKLPPSSILLSTLTPALPLQGL